jgi:hypothetical protein
MRDVQRLRQLSSATALGLWAEDAILALDRVARLHQRSSSDVDRLLEAAGVLEAALGQSEEPLVAPAAEARSIAATDTALDVAEGLVEDSSPEKTQAMLREIAGLLRSAVGDDLGDDAVEKIEPAIDFFSAVGKHQLAAGNSVSSRSRGLTSWTAEAPTFSFS